MDAILIAPVVVTGREIVQMVSLHNMPAFVDATTAGRTNASVALRSAMAEFTHPVVTDDLANPGELDKWIVVPSGSHVVE